MSSAQQQRSAVPLDQQSVLPTVRGLPWWGAVLVATVVTAIGAAIDANNTDALGGVFKFCYLLGCVAAALMVRRRALFTAGAQPPLIAFLVGVITLYGINADQASSGLKSLIFKVLLPIANDFPWMALTFLVTLGLVIARWYLTRGDATPKRAGTSPKGSGASRAGAKPTPRDKDGNRRPRTAAGRSATGSTARKRPTRPRTDDAKADRAERKRSDAPSASRRTDGSRSGTRRTETPRPTAGQARPKRPDSPTSGTRAATSGSRGETKRPAPARRTAGAMLRDEAGERIDPAGAADSATTATRAPRTKAAPVADAPERRATDRSGTDAADYPSTRSRNRG